MCSPSCLAFAERTFLGLDLQGKTVLEAGALNVNGSMRGIISKCNPLKYTGVDIKNGPGVDRIADVSDLVQEFGEESFDVVVSTELLEHVREWRKAVSGLKRVLRRNGMLLVTTRSRGVPYHGYPWDFWRYEVEDGRELFSDMNDLEVSADPDDPGIFIKAIKPEKYTEYNLDSYQLWSVIRRRRCVDVSDYAVRRFLLLWPLWRRLVEIAPISFRKKVSQYRKQLRRRQRG